MGLSSQFRCIPIKFLGDGLSHTHSHTHAVHLSLWSKKEVIGHWLRGKDGELPPNSDLPATFERRGEENEKA